MPKILASDAFKNGGVLFLLWDEGARHSGDDPPFIVISPNAKPGFVSNVDYDTSSYLWTVQAILGLDACRAAIPHHPSHNMDNLFTVPLASSAPASSSSIPRKSPPQPRSG